MPPDHQPRAGKRSLVALSGLVVFWLACLLSAPALAEPPQLLTLESDTDEIDPTPAVLVFEEESGPLSLHELLGESPDWQAHQQKSLHLGLSDNAWWLKFRVHNVSDQDRQYYLETGFAPLNRISVYTRTEGFPGQHFEMGNNYPFHQRPVTHRYFVTPLEFPAGKITTVYMRAENKGTLRVPLMLHTPENFLAHDLDRQLVMSLYFGAILIMLLYNFLIYISLRDRAYLFFIGYIGTLALLVATVTGYSFRYLWPEAMVWNQRGVGALITLSVLMGNLFTIEFLRLRDHNSTLATRLMVRTIWLALLVMTAAVAFLDYTRMLVWVLLGLTLGCFLSLALGLATLVRGERMARYYLLAWGVLVAGGLITMASRMGFIHQTILTENAAQIGSVLLVALLSFALAARINEERRLRLQAQKESLLQEHKVRRAREEVLETQKKANLELEQRVRERTRKLEEANRRLHDSNLTDPLTGLRNRRFLDEQLQVEYSRCFRYGHVLSLIFIDIDHFKSFNDDHGHQFGDACLREVALAIEAAVVRDADLVARYGGEEFCILLPETGAEGALAVAERVRRSVETRTFPVDDRHVPLTVSVGVASHCPTSADASRSLVREADLALYRAKEEGRNRVIRADGRAS